MSGHVGLALATVWRQGHRKVLGSCRLPCSCSHTCALLSCALPPPVLPEARAWLGWDGEATSSRVPCCALSCSRVLQSVVLLSDSQLHLFLQSQLSVPEIEACVQGRGSLTVSDAILCYAMSNCGWAQEERQSTSHLAKGDQLNR